MNIQDNDFELFGLPLRYAQPQAVLDSRWKQLQAQVHPDRFAAQGEAAQRLAMQWSVRVNEAYRRLRDPLRRAAYLCELKGTPPAAGNNTAMSPEFLVQQMAWREQLEDASDQAQCAELVRQVETARQKAMGDCERLLDVEDDPAAAAHQVRSMMFLERMLDEARDRMDTLRA
jgi:molecular chaperone HscB